MKKKIIAFVLALSLAITPTICNPNTVSAATKSKKITIYKGQTVKYTLIGIINSKVKWKVTSGKNKVSIKTSGKYKKNVKIKGKKVGKAVVRAKVGSSVFKFKVKIKNKPKKTTSTTKPTTKVPEKNESTVENTTTKASTTENTTTTKKPETENSTTESNNKTKTVTKTIDVVPQYTEGESALINGSYTPERYYYINNEKHVYSTAGIGFGFESGKHYTKVRITLDRKIENAKIVYLDGSPQSKPKTLEDAYTFNESNGYSYETTGYFGTYGFASSIKVETNDSNVKGSATCFNEGSYNYNVNLTDISGYDMLILDPNYSLLAKMGPAMYIFNTRPDLGESATPSAIIGSINDNTVLLPSDAKLATFSLDTNNTNLGIIQYTYKLVKK